MRILTVSDIVEPVLYGPYIRERVGPIDLILACGDLPNYYLDYIASMLDRPLYYVHGNHDRVAARRRDGSSGIAADALSWAINLHARSGDDGSGTAAATLSWAVNLHARTVHHEGLLLAGLEGCRAYNPGAPYQYSESQVKRQVRELRLRLVLNQLRYGRCLDILITHAPPRGIHDGKDLPHRGFESYLGLLHACRPALMIHGHQHVYNRNESTETDYDGTRIINTYGYRVLELAQRRDTGRWEVVSGTG